MNLRQIIRNQKLSSFDLISLIEADEEEVKYQATDGKSKTMAVSAALKQKPDHPARIAAERLRKSKDAPQKKAQDDEVKVKISDEERKTINSFGEEIGLHPSDTDPDVFVDDDDNAVMTIGSDGTLLAVDEPGELSDKEAKDFEKRIDDFNDSTGAAAKFADFMNNEDPKEKEDDDASAAAAAAAEERDAPEVTEGPMDNEQIKEELDYIQDVTGKDKKLESDANPKESSEWTDTDIEPDDEDFDKWAKRQKPRQDRPANQKIDMDDMLRELGIDPKNANFPQKYYKVLERLINTKPGSNPKTDSISDFIDGAGAGMLSSQAGEILTMMVTSMPDDEAQAFSDKITEVLDRQDGKQILDKSWVKAAMANRQATINHIKSKYGPDAKITAGCWDVGNEVEAIGMSDYKKNKGYSTDAYFTVETPQYDGPLLLESSLKKDKNVLFFNGGTTDILKPKCISKGDPKGCSNMGWGLTDEQFVDLDNPNPPPDVISGDSYHPHEFKKSQVRLYLENNEALTDSAAAKSSISVALERFNKEGATPTDKKYLLDLMDSLNAGGPGLTEIRKGLGIKGTITEKNIKELGPKLAVAIMENYTKNFDKDGNKLSPGEIKDAGGIPVAEKDLNKVAASLVKSAPEWTGKGPPDPKDPRYALADANKRMNEEHSQYALNLSRALLLNKDLNDGLMSVLRDEFPIKAAAQGEEIMTIGDMVLDRKTCKALFGTANFNEIKERLSIREDEKGNPTIVYSVKGDDEYIPIAYIDIRQKGKGYAGPPSFNMGVDKRFAKRLAEKQEVLKQESTKYLGNILSETQENTLAHHWKKAEDNYPIHYFIRELNKDSLN